MSSLFFLPRCKQGMELLFVRGKAGWLTDWLQVLETAREGRRRGNVKGD